MAKPTYSQSKPIAFRFQLKLALPYGGGFDAQCLHPLMVPSRFAVSAERFHYRTGSKWASRITVQRDSHEITKTGGWGGVPLWFKPIHNGRSLSNRIWWWTNIRRAHWGKKKAFDDFLHRLLVIFFCLRSIYTQMRLHKWLLGGILWNVYDSFD